LAAPGETPLIEALKRNVYGAAPPPPAAPALLAAYVREAVRDVNSQQSAGISAGKLRLPDPKAIVLVEDKGHVAEN
jgi:hypothetical protein